jgi:hypothetical protein
VADGGRQSQRAMVKLSGNCGLVKSPSSGTVLYHAGKNCQWKI